MSEKEALRMGKTIEFLRLCYGYSQREFAGLIELSPQSVCSIEQCRNDITTRVMEKIADAFNIPVWKIYKIDHLIKLTKARTAKQKRQRVVIVARELDNS